MSLEISQDQFENEVLKSNKPVLVDFFAIWCGPCKAIAPILGELSSENQNVKIVKIDVDKCSELAVQYRIQSIPTMIFFKDGKPVNQRVGGGSKADLQKWIEDNTK